MEPPISLQVHRSAHNASKLPSYRSVDLTLTATNLDNNARLLQSVALPLPSTILDTATTTSQTNIRKGHARNLSELVATSTPPLSAPLNPRPLTSPSTPTYIDASSQPAGVARHKPTRNVPALRSGNNSGKGPPPAMITQKLSLHEIDNPTKDWVVNQSLTTSSPIDDRKPLPAEPTAEPTKPITPLIPPIRGFRTSRKSSVENATSPRSPRLSMDQDDTLRALDGYTPQRTSRRDQEEQSSDDSDLFLKLAREEAAGTTRGPIRRSHLNRQSLPPNHTIFQTSASRRRGSDQESSSGEQNREDPSMALTYRPSLRERMPTALDMSRNRYYGGTSHSTPTTPRAAAPREVSPESQVSYSRRRPSIPDHNLPSRAGSYRQSNLSYSAPRTYNSSPLVSRTTDNHDTPETHRNAEGTESTVSTTAPSTVWDELDDLKSRIHRLELTGKLPTTSGAAMSRVSNDRPPTATTTVTTMSSSPKRGRGNSISPVDSNTIEPPPHDAHPLLNSALAKSKTLLSPEIYKALEATASDALNFTAMLGSSGQPGPISSSQSTIGGGLNVVSDRQLRRKADSMCRSLTELCLALSEGKSDQTQTKALSRPSSRDAELNIDTRLPVSSDLARVKASPRALSRLEARRSSLLATSTLPSPRYTPSEVGTPTQSSIGGRRTSLLLRSRRAATEELDDDDESRFRAPSRAATEIGRIRQPTREYTPPTDSRTPTSQSSLPVRRHYASSSFTSSGSALPAVSNIAGRRYLDRSTPERDTASLSGRMGEDREKRKSSIGASAGFGIGRAGSLTRRTRQGSSMDASSSGNASAYQ